MSIPGNAQYSDNDLLAFTARYLNTQVDGVGEWGRTPAGEFRRPLNTFVNVFAATVGTFTGTPGVVVNPAAGASQIQFRSGGTLWGFFTWDGASIFSVLDNGGSNLWFTTSAAFYPGSAGLLTLGLPGTPWGNAFLADIEINGALNHDGTTVGFYGTAPIVKQVGVAVTAAAIHTALTALGLIAP